MRPERAARALVAGLAVGVATACAPDDETSHSRFLAFGTLVEVDVYGTDEKTAARAAADIEACFHVLHDAWHPWAEGELGRINRAIAAGEPAPIGEDLAGLLAEASRLSRDSGGLFDPTLGRLVALWGFADDEQSPVAPPAGARIRALLDAGTGPDRLRVDGRTISSTSRAIAVDLGGFAKGVAVDRAIERLRRLGVTNAIVNAGGDLRVIGRHGDRPWRIGIRHPRRPGIMAELEVDDGESVFTSGDYERHFVYRGRRYHHILDPRTGEPAANAVSVTVLGDDAARADAAATALFVAGAGAWRAVAGGLGVEHVMLVAPDGRIEMSTPMAGRLRLTRPPAGGEPRIELEAAT
ncbi:MAG TPA: FAD:protein FMN transferase [Gammaproteobacteria bacterium]|nr:FAD:protein FMN transferase [Gammaproteobacteria bacterium]